MPNSTVVTNTYNGEGLRVAKAVNGDVTQYLYEYDKVVLELNGEGEVTARNTYGTNLLSRTLYSQNDSQTVFYMYNGHADVTALLDNNGAIVAQYYYDVFGNILSETGSISNPFRYAGYQYDPETKLYYLNARMYDPKLARFLQEDTYRGDPNDPLSLNLYTYCHNEPIKYYDPTGHWPDWAGIGQSLNSAWNGTVNAVKQVANNVENTASKVIKKATSVTKKVVQGTGKMISKTANYIADHKKEIAIGAVATASVIVGAALIASTGGAATPLVMAAGSALLGGGLALGVSGATDYFDNGRIDGTFSEYAGTYAGGAVTGALLPGGAGLSLGKSALWTGISSATGSVARQSISNGTVDYGQVAMEGVAGTALHYGIGTAAPYVYRGLQSIKNGIGGLLNNSKQILANENGYVNLNKFNKGVGKTGGGGRGANNLKSDPAAEGSSHSTFKTDTKTGKITNYETYESNPRNPNGVDKVKRYDGTGDSHYNKKTGEDIVSPHVHDPSVPGGVRKPYPDEIPK